MILTSADMHVLTDAVDAFLTYCRLERNFSIHTVKAYRLDLNQFNYFTVERCGCDRLSNVNQSLVRDYTRSLNRYKPRTQKRKLAALKSLFGFLEREGVVDPNPTRNLRLHIRIGRDLPRTISLQTLQTLFRKVYAEHDRRVRQNRSSALAVRDIALVELMFSSGM